MKLKQTLPYKLKRVVPILGLAGLWLIYLSGIQRI